MCLDGAGGTHFSRQEEFTASQHQQVFKASEVDLKWEWGKCEEGRKGSARGLTDTMEVLSVCKIDIVNVCKGGLFFAQCDETYRLNLCIIHLKLLNHLTSFQTSYTRRSTSHCLGSCRPTPCFSKLLMKYSSHSATLVTSHILQ